MTESIFGKKILIQELECEHQALLGFRDLILTPDCRVRRYPQMLAEARRLKIEILNLKKDVNRA